MPRLESRIAARQTRGTLGAGPLKNGATKSPLLDKKSPVLPDFCREEATRTPDPYVPNVVRYQLRYFSKIKARNLPRLNLTLMKVC